MERSIFKSITSYCGLASSQRDTPCGELSLLQLINVTLPSKAVGNWAFYLQVLASDDITYRQLYSSHKVNFAFDSKIVKLG